MQAPTPEAIRAARDAAGLTQAEAAELVHLGRAVRWSEYERGHPMDAARWELFLVKVGQHPALPHVLGQTVMECLALELAP